MEENSVIEIWKTCAYNPNAGQWILRNLYAGQIYNLSKEVDNIIGCVGNIIETRYVKEDINLLVSSLESCKDTFSNFLEGQLCSDVTSHDVIKAYDRLTTEIDSIKNQIATITGQRSKISSDTYSSRELEKEVILPALSEFLSEALPKLREELDKLSDATYIPTFIKEEVSA